MTTLENQPQGGHEYTPELRPELWSANLLTLAVLDGSASAVENFLEGRVDRGRILPPVGRVDGHRPPTDCHDDPHARVV